MKSIRQMLNIANARDRNRRLICSAIRARHPIEFYYHGGFRTVEPFCLGLVMEGGPGNESLLCYQTGGFSELREVVGWKLYRANDMEDIAIGAEIFTADRPGYSPDEVPMTKIYCCVTPVMPLPRIAPGPADEKPPAPPARRLTHNEIMRRFRERHPDDPVFHEPAFGKGLERAPKPGREAAETDINPPEAPVLTPGDGGSGARARPRWRSAVSAIGRKPFLGVLRRRGRREHR